MVRKAVVADRFYPGNQTDLQDLVTKLIPADNSARKKVISAISPHAGYIYSGALAAQTLSSIHIPHTVLLLGPNHTGMGLSAALSEDNWQIPTGTIHNSKELSQILLTTSSIIQSDTQAHLQEHSLEVQLPFLHALNPDVEIVPVTLSFTSFEQCQQLGKDIATAIKSFGKDVLILVSSDMNHFKSRREGSQLDQLALSQLQKLDAYSLYSTVIKNRISMCGVIPATIGMIASIELGAQHCDLINYSDSGDISGDIESVVGYAGLIIY